MSNFYRHCWDCGATNSHDTKFCYNCVADLDKGLCEYCGELHEQK